MKESQQSRVIETWNNFVECLMDAQTEWEFHREYMMGLNFESLPIEAQRIMRTASIHKATTFERALLNFVNEWLITGGLKSKLIKLEEK